MKYLKISIAEQNARKKIKQQSNYYIFIEQC